MKTINKQPWNDVKITKDDKAISIVQGEDVVIINTQGAVQLIAILQEFIDASIS